ncbi:MAG: glycoside hydrolase family 95 protein [Marinilabiliaceae bacterium]|nr:glycoside hydrolase family 95 protein [Marinilabiliaceae bacterium]
MKIFFKITLISSFVLTINSCNIKDSSTIELWYDKPASTWEEALPIGNGRLGAMIYGDTTNEKIQFNEETLWNGEPRDYNNENAHLFLENIRTLLFDNKKKEAEKIASEAFMGKQLYENDYNKLKKEWYDSIINLPIIVESNANSYNDNLWDTMYINNKSVWERKGLPDMDGAVLFRKTIVIPDEWIGLDLKIELGKIKDQDFSFINGHLIGSLDGGNTNRTYIIPNRCIKKGSNTLNILINNYTSTGGFNAVRKPPFKMNIIPVNKTTNPLFIEGTWKYKVIDKKPPFYPQYQASYQPFGEIKIDFEKHDNITNYKRCLNLEKAIKTVTYDINGVKYKREYFASFPNDVIIINITATGKGNISFNTTFESVHEINNIFKFNDNTLGLNVKVEDGVMKGTALMNVSINGGTIITDNNFIKVSKANSATIKLVANTNYISYKEVGADPLKKAEESLKKVAGLNFDDIKNCHVEDYQKLFNRFSIDLGQKENRLLTTNTRIDSILKRPDNDLTATYVQYARYLMISSGREGTNPANLQGIWNKEIHPAWGSKYTTNINCEMNYWPVEPLNISECHNSLFKMIDEIAEAGAKTAKNHYNANGWVLHHNTDQWRGTAPINNSNHGIWPTGGAWLCHHLWEHYLYSQDTIFLKNKAYPLIKEATNFFIDFLSEDPKSEYLISTPSNSPEHGGLVAGPAMDHQIIRSLFKITLQCIKILNLDNKYAELVAQKLNRIAPDKIGQYGQLQEWMQDIDDTTDTHRHISHLWGVHPGNEINWEETVDLMNAAKKSLIYRGDDGTGWSLAWKINFWARFLDGEHAHKMIQMLLSPQSNPNRPGSGGSYPNLFDAHPPFQIDGNFGGAAGIAEMLIQSHMGYIHLLPALPIEWHTGSIKGMKARGGLEIDMYWKNGKLSTVKIISTFNRKVKFKYRDIFVEKELKTGKSVTINNW